MSIDPAGGGGGLTTKVHLLIAKDLISECRSRQVWPVTLQLGVLVAVLFSLQLELPGDQQRRITGPLLWFAILFASLPTLERSFASEREDRCLDGLLLAPVAPATVYLAKLAVNLIVLIALAGLMVPLWTALLGVPLLASPAAIVLVTLLGNLGIAAVGTLLSALLSGLGPRSGGLALLVLPLVIPVLIAASESTRLILEDDLGPEWWRWVLFLATFAVVFVVAGAALFEFAVRD
jgi:heme exporter protein B